jgi:hypothetical protein
VTPTTLVGIASFGRTSRFLHSEEAVLRVGRRASLVAGRAAPHRGPRCVRRSDAHLPRGRTASPGRKTCSIGRPTWCTPSREGMHTTVRCASPTWKKRFLQSYDVHHSVGRRCSSAGRSTAPVGRHASLNRWMPCIGSIDLVLPQWGTRSTAVASSSPGRRRMPSGWKMGVSRVGGALHTMGEARRPLAEGVLPIGARSASVDGTRATEW